MSMSMLFTSTQYKFVSTKSQIRSLFYGFYFRVFKIICILTNFFAGELCGLSFSTLVKYQNHVRLKHTFEKPFKCNECEKAYATSSCLSEHKRRAHTEPIPCSSCLKVFPSADSLSRHFKLTHREKKFICEFEGCGKKFANPSLLKNHTFVHSEQKKFQCKFCPHSYYKG